ncbi:MAG: hypothetical protein Q4C03_01080 [bacterium]|nr:hypothetical protein [bacterium]
MKQAPSKFDFMYAVRHTSIVCAPKRLLDPFDQTTIDYTLLAQPMDDPHKTRVRMGKLQTYPPRLVLPGDLSVQELEGFGPQAERYLEFLQTHASKIRILRYSYRLKREKYTEHLLSEPLDIVKARVKAEMAEKQNPYASLLVGVDEPWDVCLLHLFMKLVQASVPKTLEQMEQRAQQSFRDHLPPDDRQEIERAFAAAAKDPSLIKELGRLLKSKGLFEMYQDRFFALIK